jgi:hypothetical protein
MMSCADLLESITVHLPYDGIVQAIIVMFTRRHASGTDGVALETATVSEISLF